ncbi:MAG: hypothetical protein GW878_00545 [Acidobacteria bacterium]|nr:hypothetical protein [Acidobacteriota bacterium]
MSRSPSVHFKPVAVDSYVYFLAFPGVLTADQGDLVEFTGDEATLLFFPEPEIFVEATPMIVAVAKHEPFARHLRKLNPDGPRETHQYAAFSRESANFALGGSNPKIIIGP